MAILYLMTVLQVMIFDLQMRLWHILPATKRAFLFERTSLVKVKCMV